MFHGFYIINLVIMGEVLLAEHMFAHHLLQRENYGIRLTLSTLLCLLAGLLLPQPKSFGYACILYLLIFALSGIALCVCYAEDFWSILFLCTAGYTIQHLSYTLNFLLNQALSTAQADIPYAVKYFCTMIPTLFFCYFAFSGQVKKYHKIQIDNKKIFLLSILSVFINIYMNILFLPYSENREFSRYVFLSNIMTVIICILILCIQFSLLSNKRMETELLVMEQLLREEGKQYKYSKDTIQLINIKCHDLKYQIRRMRKQQDAIDKESLKEIENAIGIYDSAVHTNNEALNVILTEKSLICEKEGITLSCMIDSENPDFISSPDIYSLFGNALDNAIEAVSKISSPEYRTISINLKKKGAFLAIHIENYFEGTITMRDGLPVTSKEDASCHGFGMKSIKMLVEKYNGHLTVETDGQIFHLIIIIPIPSTQS